MLCFVSPAKFTDSFGIFYFREDILFPFNLKWLVIHSNGHYKTTKVKAKRSPNLAIEERFHVYLYATAFVSVAVFSR